jgi:hypothetical protein
MTHSHVRGIVGVLGVSFVVLGGVIAWRADSSTPVLVVGGLLVMAALLGDRVEKLIVRRDGTEAELSLSGLASKAERAVFKAIRAEDPEEVRAELELAREYIRSLDSYVKRLAHVHEPRNRLRTQFFWSLGTVCVALEPDGHMLNGTLQCTVQHPDGSIDVSQTDGPSDPKRLVQMPLEPLGVPGRYEVTWDWSFTREGGGLRQVGATSAVVPDDAKEGWESPWT